MASDREIRASMAHDVGKYVARIARNVAPGAEVPKALAPLLVKDLYETHAGKRASARFEELAGALAAAPPSVEVAKVALAKIDALEARVRAGEAEALTEAAALARAVGDLCQQIAAEGVQ